MSRKKIPSSEEEQRKRLDSFFMNLDGESDRGCVLVSGAIIDECLEVLLRARLLKDEPKLINSLFSGQGPLSSFWSKIQFARAMEVISPWIYEDLERIRSLRNLFAHRYDSADFNDEEVTAITSKLKGADHTVIAIKEYEAKRLNNSSGVRGEAKSGTKDGYCYPSKKERVRFIFSVASICAELQARPKILELQNQITQQKLQLLDVFKPDFTETNRDS